MGTSGWSAYGDDDDDVVDNDDVVDDDDDEDERCSLCVVSSELRVEGCGAGLSFFGEGGLLGAAALFHCAACEGSVTVAVTGVFVFWDCRATLKRFGRLLP